MRAARVAITPDSTRINRNSAVEATNGAVKILLDLRNEILILINHLINKRVRLEQRDNLAVRRRIAESLSSQGFFTGCGDKGRDCVARVTGYAPDRTRKRVNSSNYCTSIMSISS